VITAADEGPRQDGEGFADVVAVDIWDAEQDLFAAIRIARLPALGTSSVAAVVAIEGEPVLQVVEGDTAAIEDWAAAAVAGVELVTREPLQHWDARIDTAAGGLECELRATSVPMEPHANGVRRYVQLCEARGSVSAGGRRRRFAGRALRAHSWGESAQGQRRRFVHAAAEDGALVSVVAARPPGATAHGEELVEGLTVDPWDGEAHPLDEVRLSTVFDGHGMPRKAGLELYRPGDEMPARLSGEAAWGTTLETGAGPRTVSFFRWTLEGRPGWGTYEEEPAS
jgi:hypothetical protein